MTSLGFIVGLIVASVFVLAGLAGVVIGRVIIHRDEIYDAEFVGRMYFWPGVLVILLTAGISAAGFYPYDMQYHRYKHVEGTVDVAEARMLADGDGTSQTFAVRFKESGETYRCDDTRCSLLKPGDHLSLWCIRQWEYASTSGWACRFDKTRPAGVTK